MALARWQRTITDNAGNVLPNAAVEVKREVPGQPLAPLFADRDGAVPITNPFNADADGFAAFHCVGGAFQVKASAVVGGTPVTRTWRYVGVGTLSEFDLETVENLIDVDLEAILTAVTVRIDKPIHTPGTGGGNAGFFDIDYDYAGGTPGFVNTPLFSRATTSAGVTDFVWSFLSILDNHATAGENVAAYFQGNKFGVGSTWAGVFEVDDKTEVADPIGAIYALELDLVANGTDANNVRRGSDLVFWRSNIAGADAEFAYGHLVQPAIVDIGHVFMKKAFAIEGLSAVGAHTATYGIGFDFSGATYENGAIKLGDDRAISPDSAGNVLWAYGSAEGKSLVSQNTAAGNANLNALRLRHTANGTFGVGMGVGLEFESEVANGVNKLGGFIANIFNDVTGASEDAQLEFGVMVAGAAPTTKVTLTGTDWSPFVSGGLGLGTAAKGWNHAHLAAATALHIGGSQVVGPRDTGWAAMTGTPNKTTTYNTGTITLVQLAERVKALQDVFMNVHGVIGP